MDIYRRLQPFFVALCPWGKKGAEVGEFARARSSDSIGAKEIGYE